MVVRQDKNNRKFLGSRHWGVGNIKNARGKGSRGGVGNAGSRKQNFTYMTAKTPWLLSKKGFTPWNQKKHKEITLKDIDLMLRKSKDAKATLELGEYKVLSNGTLSKPAVIRARGFTKQAAEKIKSAGGEAVVI